ncbi:alpha/beta hydrolase family protein [Anabaena subtropica]|uniref:Dienelactone hydrolase n=1 Tax=Anabaena subtropica FACHB-260 TaxID=2692884 RepID=A0ABR8CW21_9NOST|nr:dienelactone hydrolase [Anabaena subtropica]MBD2347274.1 dienelactone hydrolase [Anabaena subtropica FACHB-260]
MQTVQALLTAAKVESAKSPYDTIHIKILYPAQNIDSDLEKNWGMLPVDAAKAPFPVVIFFNGFNCDAQKYQWLGIELAQTGLVVVMFNWIGESLPGLVSFTPGFDIEKRKREFYGTAPTASALPAILAKLEDLQTEGILAGTLDLQKIILGGHSEGGRLAMENANPSFFPQVVASFAYGSNTAGAIILGYEANTILPLPDTMPRLVMGGTCDGVIANSSSHFGLNTKDAITPVIRTFQEAILGGRGDSYLLLLEGANHFSIVDTVDSTLSIPFTDFLATQPQEDFRLLIADIINLFIDVHVRQQPEALPKLEQLLIVAHPLIKSFERK